MRVFSYNAVKLHANHFASGSFVVFFSQSSLVIYISLIYYAAICSLTRPWEAFVIGAIGALLACPGCALLERLRIDDPVGCVPTHLVAGIWGLMAVAFFAEKDILENRFSNEFGILKGGPWRFLGVQLLTVVAVSAWAALSTFLQLLLVNRLLGLRMSVEDELMGADKVEHGIDEHDPNSTPHSHGVNANENGHEDALKSVQVNQIGLEAAEIDGTPRTEETSPTEVAEQGLI